jgi:N-acetylmuramoyl-L-alanine amidase
MPFTTRELFARLLKCEAGGEGEDGMKAVASVVMNRAHSNVGEFSRISDGGNVRNIIEQLGQFDCVREVVGGKYNPQNVWNIAPEQIHYDIADWALAGNILLGVDNSLFYFNPYSPSCPTYFPPGGAGVVHNKINQHCFYIPTEKYKST